jgi:5'-methylthioadenosine phosphorylase
MTKALIGIIGGSGIYDLPGLQDLREERVKTPWGEPSDALRFGRIGGTDAVFLPRHGRGHRLSPSGINYRANIDALKRVGVTDIVSVSACGSFREELAPGTFVLVDQFIDRTHGRASSFFGNGCVAHVSMAHPVAPKLQDCIEAAALKAPVNPLPAFSPVWVSIYTDPLHVVNAIVFAVTKSILTSNGVTPLGKPCVFPATVIF